jgi:putative membrane protein
MAAYTSCVDIFWDRSVGHSVIKEAGTAAYSSVVLGLLLVFRTNTAYERWNEGRKLWGQLVNDSRSICLKVRSFVSVPESEKIQFGQLVISFAYALKHHLRKTTPTEPLPGLGRSAQGIKHMPVHVSGKIFDLLQSWRQAGLLDNLQLIQLDAHLRAFMDVCGGCERIKNSPIAVSYRAFMRQGIIFNLLFIPWFLAPEFSLILCLPLILMGTYFLIGLELIAEDIEDPFGWDGDDLPLDTICGSIRSSITDILSLHKALKYTRSAERAIPDPLKH